MIELSPAAQAVHQAFITAPLCAEVKLATAFEALADQVVPRNANPVGDEHDSARADLRERIRYRILIIAAELRGTDH